MTQSSHRWVGRTVVLIGVALAVVLVASVVRIATRPSLQPATAGTGSISSQKELIAAIRNPAMRDEAIRKLSGQTDVEVVALLGDLSLKSQDADVRAACLAALGHLRDPAGVHPLSIGARDLEPAVRVAALYALAEIGNGEACMAMTGALTDVDPAVRQAAADGLSKSTGQDAIVSPVIDALAKEENPNVRLALVAVLGTVTNEPARAGLVSVLQADNAPPMRAAALASLLRVDDVYRVKGIVCAMADADETLAQTASARFGELDAAAVPALDVALRSGEFARCLSGRRGETVLGEVVQRLAGFASPAAAPALLRALDVATETGRTDDLRFPRVRRLCVDALAQLGTPAVDVLGRDVLKPAVRLSLKSAAADVFVAIGEPAGAALKAYIGGYAVLPTQPEADLWEAALPRIPGAAAAEALKALASRNPKTYLAQLAAEAAQTMPSPVPASTPVAPAEPGLTLKLVLHGGQYQGNPPSVYARRQANLPWLVRKGAESEPAPTFQPSGRSSLTLYLFREAGEWRPVMGTGFNQGVHMGKVDSATLTDDAVTFRIRLGIGSDPWLAGGYGEYAIEMKRQADGTFEGRYTGKTRQLPIDGRATCSPAPAYPPPFAGYTPVAAGEHPRMLFRKGDLPRLRTRLNTPLGRAAYGRMASSSDPVSLGVVYQLTGDRAYAERAIPQVQAEMDNHDFGFRGLGQVWGPRLSAIALAYDLCCEAWPKAFRADVERYLVLVSNQTSTNMGKFSTCANWDPCSNFFAPIQGGGAMLSLAYWMDPGPAPVAPAGAAILALAALAAAPAGVPLQPLQERRSPTDWIWTGAIPGATGADALADAALRASPAVRDGGVFAVAGVDYRFEPVPADCRRRDGVYPWTAFAERYADEPAVGLVLHTVVEVIRPGFFTVRLPPEGSSALRINGLPVQDRSMVRLDIGFYPLTLAFTKEQDVMGSVGLAFERVADTEQEARQALDFDIEQSARKQLWYEIDKAEWDRTGMDAQKLHIFRRCWFQMFRCYRELMGDGGFQSEGERYTYHAMTPVRYADAYWGMFGRSPTPHPDVTHFAFRYLMASVIAPDGKGGKTLRMQAFNAGDGISAGIDFMVTGFDLMPARYQPGALWIWNQLRGVDPARPETMAEVVGAGWGGPAAVYAFLNYPLDLAPQPPATCFPKTYEAPTKGLYVFRNAWSNADDIVFQLYANAKRSGGHGQSNAGALRLLGLGHTWLRTNAGRDSPRHEDSVVMLPEHFMSPSAEGKVLASDGGGDGSGYVSVDLDGVYAPAGAKAVAQRQKAMAEHARRYEKEGFTLPDLVLDPNVRGLRAAAVDYSGECGAPALIVLVDKVEGGRKRQWLWHLPDGFAGTVTAESGGRAFLIRQGGATLRGTFVCPAGVKVSIGPVAAAMDAAMAQLGSKGSALIAMPGNTGIVADGEPGTSFFVVCTLQRGAAPEVAVESGEGLNSVVTVGGRRIRFDGTRPVIE